MVTFKSLPFNYRFIRAKDADVRPHTDTFQKCEIIQKSQISVSGFSRTVTVLSSVRDYHIKAMSNRY